MSDATKLSKLNTQIQNTPYQHTPIVHEHTHIDIWPDFTTAALAFLVVVAVFYFTGLELSFEKNNRAGIYMEFTKIERY